MISIYDYDYDYILLVKATDHKIMETLHQDFNIPMEKILDHSIFALYRDTDIKIEPNQSAIREGINSDQKFLIISNSAPSTGLGAILLIVARNVRYARENGYIPVVDMTHANQYLYEDEIGRVNAWQKFFLQPAGYSLDDAMKSENLYSSALRRQEKLNDETNVFDFLKPTPQLLKFYSVMEEQLSGKKLLGVLFRGTDYVNLKPYGHFIQPTLEQMIMKVKEKIEEWGGFDGVYVCTEVETAIKEFETNISIPVYYYPQKRFPQDTDSLLYKIEFERENDKFLRGAEYFSALLWLSKCDSLVAGLCGGTDAALGLNNKKYKNQYIFSLGRYGIDDIL